MDTVRINSSLEDFIIIQVIFPRTIFIFFIIHRGVTLILLNVKIHAGTIFVAIRPN